jgi:hypothetical protein
MSAKTNFLQAAVLSGVLRNSAYTPAATVYVALFTTAPTDAYTSGSPTGVEVSGNAYAREAIAFGAPSGTPRVTANSGVITYPTATPSGWGTVVAFGIFDALTTGNLLYWALLTANKTIGAGDIFQFAVGAVTITEN